jgi:hypothetical protein
MRIKHRCICAIGQILVTCRKQLLWSHQRPRLTREHRFVAGHTLEHKAQLFGFDHALPCSERSLS